MSEGSEQEDKTEEPTERRINQAIEKGNVPKSAELATFFVTAAGFLSLFLIGSSGVTIFIGMMRGFLVNSYQSTGDSAQLIKIAYYSAEAFFRVMMFPFILAVFAGIASGLVMHRPLWTFEPMMPKFERISPMSGFKRIFGREAWVQFFKSLLKFFIIGFTLIIILWPERERLGRLINLDLAQFFVVSWELIVKLFGYVLAIYAVLVILDVLYQRFTWHQNLRMTREELKQEFKETEGSPEIKGRIRKLRMELLSRRMMAQVPKASVIITNPTHYAVALRYEAGMNAPVLIAKGVNSLALKIREVAEKNEIPMIENPPLARVLHAKVDIDDEIPEEHYKAVAEVIGYVMKLRRKKN